MHSKISRLMVLQTNQAITNLVFIAWSQYCAAKSIPLFNVFSELGHGVQVTVVKNIQLLFPSNADQGGKLTPPTKYSTRPQWISNQTFYWNCINKKNVALERLESPKGQDQHPSGQPGNKSFLYHTWLASVHGQHLFLRLDLSMRLKGNPRWTGSPLQQTGCSLLGPLPHLSPFALQPAHALLPPLRSHVGDVSRKES